MQIFLIRANKNGQGHLYCY